MFNLSQDQVERAKKIHSSSTVVDTHNDTILHLINSPPFISTSTNPTLPRRTLGERSKHGQIDIPRIQEGGVNCLLFAMYVNPQYKSRLLRLIQMFDTFQTEIRKNRNTIAIVTSYKEIVETMNYGKIAAIITVEGGEPLENRIESLRAIYRLGARSLTLTHFPRNELGDGSGADNGSHLTSFGCEVVEEMNRLGMIVDISHLNETGFWDVIEHTTDPILATHSNCKALCNHHRNLTDDQIKALGERGGIINLSFCTGFIKEDMGFVKSVKKVTIEDWKASQNQ
jgi:membrane dipeptidase